MLTGDLNFPNEWIMTRAGGDVNKAVSMRNICRESLFKKIQKIIFQINSHNNIPQPQIEGSIRLDRRQC